MDGGVGIGSNLLDSLIGGVVSLVGGISGSGLCGVDLLVYVLFCGVNLLCSSFLGGIDRFCGSFVGSGGGVIKGGLGGLDKTLHGLGGHTGFLGQTGDKGVMACGTIALLSWLILMWLVGAKKKEEL